MKKNNLFQILWDFIGIPFRFVLFDQKWLPQWGWTTFERDRINAVFPHIQGKLLDVGAGPNQLVREYGNGIGIDVHDWGHGVVVVDDTSHLPYADHSFDTITFLASLNHIPYREKVLGEAIRVLKTDGKIIITMISPFLGIIGHKLWWYSEDKHRGGMVDGEVGGMSNREIMQLLSVQGFELTLHQRFVYGMNNLLIFTRPRIQ